MRFATGLLSGIWLLTGACATPPPPVDLSGDVIIYETSPGPWCGRCDTLKITAAADGRVWIERGYWAGDYRDWRQSRQLVVHSPEEVAAFRAVLEPHRPRGELLLQDEGCETFLTHMENRRIVWRSAGGVDLLAYNFGCDANKRGQLRDDLNAAPDALGIAPPRYVGTSTTRLR